MTQIEVRELVRTYRMGETEVRAVDGVSFEVEAGEFLAIMGPSGCGKTTMMHVLGCLDRADAGTYRLNGVEVTELGDGELARLRGRYVGFVFQAFNLIPRLTAVENVELPLVYAGVGARERRRRAREVLERVGMAHRADHSPAELSGGQQQLVSIARALVNDPVLILADEPTGNLDSATSARIMEIFSELNAEGKTIILVTHEADIAAYARRVLRMRDGKIVGDERR
ncbi:MAG: ABC transporter ATP-binding protein [Clostridia bacterium]|jgi:putative ABC transport system ATP-binding protein|nr:ABC transporter ATP-binding protein [Clostridia bacterium]MDH7573190.1 ABC transporter ATP-binding protein [Clostridia bacterium]